MLSENFQIIIVNYLRNSHPQLSDLDIILYQRFSQSKISNMTIQQFIKVIERNQMDDSKSVFVFLLTQNEGNADAIVKLRKLDRNKCKIVIYGQSSYEGLETVKSKGEILDKISSFKLVHSIMKRNRTFKLATTKHILENSSLKNLGIRVFKSKNKRFNELAVGIYRKYKTFSNVEFSEIKALKELLSKKNIKQILIVSSEEAEKAVAELETVANILSDQVFKILFKMDRINEQIKGRFDLITESVSEIQTEIQNSIPKFREQSRLNEEYFGYKQSQVLERIVPQSKSQSPSYRIRLTSAKKYKPNLRQYQFGQLFVFDDGETDFKAVYGEMLENPKIVKTIESISNSSRILLFADYQSRHKLLNNKSNKNLHFIFYAIDLVPDAIIKNANIELATNDLDALRNYFTSQKIPILPKKNWIVSKSVKFIKADNKVDQHLLNQQSDVRESRNDRKSSFVRQLVPVSSNKLKTEMCWIVKRKPGTKAFITCTPENEDLLMMLTKSDMKKSQLSIMSNKKQSIGRQKRQPSIMINQDFIRQKDLDTINQTDKREDDPIFINSNLKEGNVSPQVQNLEIAIKKQNKPQQPIKPTAVRIEIKDNRTLSRSQLKSQLFDESIQKVPKQVNEIAVQVEQDSRSPGLKLVKKPYSINSVQVRKAMEQQSAIERSSYLERTINKQDDEITPKNELENLIKNLANRDQDFFGVFKQKYLDPALVCQWSQQICSMPKLPRKQKQGYVSRVLNQSINMAKSSNKSIKFNQSSRIDLSAIYSKKLFKSNSIQLKKSVDLKHKKSDFANFPNLLNALESNSVRTDQIHNSRSQRQIASSSTSFPSIQLPNYVKEEESIDYTKVQEQAKSPRLTRKSKSYKSSKSLTPKAEVINQDVYAENLVSEMAPEKKSNLMQIKRVQEQITNLAKLSHKKSQEPTLQINTSSKYSLLPTISQSSTTPHYSTTPQQSTTSQFSTRTPAKVYTYDEYVKLYPNSQQIFVHQPTPILDPTVYQTKFVNGIYISAMKQLPNKTEVVNGGTVNNHYNINITSKPTYIQSEKKQQNSYQSLFKNKQFNNYLELQSDYEIGRSRSNDLVKNNSPLNTEFKFTNIYDQSLSNNKFNLGEESRNSRIDSAKQPSSLTSLNKQSSFSVVTMKKIHIILKKLNLSISQISHHFTNNVEIYKVHKFLTELELISICNKLSADSAVVLITDQVPQGIDRFKKFSLFDCIVVPKGKYKAQQSKYPKFKWLFDEKPDRLIKEIETTALDLRKKSKRKSLMSEIEFPQAKLFYYFEQVELESELEKNQLQKRFDLIKYYDYNSLQRRLSEYRDQNIVIVINRQLTSHIYQLKSINQSKSLQIIIYEKFYKTALTNAQSDVSMVKNVSEVLGELERLYKEYLSRK